jgi:hypothetical protein
VPPARLTDLYRFDEQLAEAERAVRGPGTRLL